MSRLGEALERLERAVTRLEAALAGGTGDAEAVRLRDAAGKIAARVDDALARVSRALGEGG